MCRAAGKASRFLLPLSARRWTFDFGACPEEDHREPAFTHLTEVLVYFITEWKAGLERSSTQLPIHTAPTEKLRGKFGFGKTRYLHNNRVDRKNANTMVHSKARGYKELTEKDKRHCLGALLAMVENGDLPHGSFAKIGKKLALAPKSVARLWKTAESTRAATRIEKVMGWALHIDLAASPHAPDFKGRRGSSGWVL